MFTDSLFFHGSSLWGVFLIVNLTEIWCNEFR